MEILNNLELREKAALVALAIGCIAIGWAEFEDYVDYKVEEMFEDGN